MKEQLIHILDQSVCLSRKQMKDYLSGTMQQEEMHAAEVHLSSCPLCSMAMEGFESASDEALAAIASLNSGFLKEHFDNIAPQIHLNSMAPAAALPSAHAARRRGQIQPVWRKASVAAALLLTLGVLWYLQSSKQDGSSRSIAMAEQPTGPAELHSTERDAVASRAADRYAQAEETADAPSAAMAQQADKQSATETSQLITSIDRSRAESSVQTEPAAAVKAKPETVAAISRQPSLELEVKASKAIKMPLATPPAGEGHLLKDASQPEKSATRPEDMTMFSAPASQRNTTGMTATRSSENKVNLEGLKTKPLDTKSVASEASSRMAQAKESFDQGKFSKALSQYRQQINQGTPQERAQARIMAARCYVELGNTAKAEELLEQVISEGSGPERRAARRLLRDLK